jgi:hypothetical protein
MDGIFEFIFYILKQKFKFKRHLIKSNHIVLWKHYVDTYGAPDFAPDYNSQKVY